MQFKYSVLTLSLAAALTLSGCGGDSSNNATSSDNAAIPDSAAKLTQGQFIDAAVEGLYYVAQPSGKSGYTDAEGKYELTEGDSITFYLGGENGLRIGSTSARAITSPFEATGNYQKALNLARILQTMDDANDGAITLPDSIKAPGATMLAALNEVQLHDIDSAEDLRKDLSKTAWVNEDDALAHLNGSLKGLERGSKEVLTDWQKGSGKFIRTVETTLTAQNITDSNERLYVQADKLLKTELFDATRGMPNTTLRLDEKQLTSLKGSNDSSVSEYYAELYLTCIDKEGLDSAFVNPGDSGTGSAQCNGTGLSQPDAQFNLGPTFDYALLSPETASKTDEAETWDEVKKFGGIFSCIAESSCSEASMTGLSTVQFDDSDNGDGSEMRKDVLSTNYDAVTGVYTQVSKRTHLTGQHADRESNSLAFAYLIDSADAERYVDFTGTWQAIETRPGCDKIAKSTYAFDNEGATVSGQEFNSDCTLVDLEANLTATYQELADMDFWWFTTNGTGNDAKATLTQLNTTVRWCDDDQPTTTCNTQKFNRWEYAPAGKNWDQGVLNRRTLNVDGTVASSISFQKQ